VKVFRVSFFYQQSADLLTGFSENFWNILSDGSSVLAAAENLRVALNTFKGFGTQTSATRISDLSGFRQTQIIKRDFEIETPTNTQDYSDFPDTAVLMKLYGPQKIVVNQWLRGVREAVVNTNQGKLGMRSADLTRFNKIKSELVTGSNGWVLRVRDPGEKLKPITGITGQGVVEVAGHGYENNDQVRISRAKGLTYANRLWKITVLTPSTFQLVGWDPVDPVAVYKGEGVVRRIVYVTQTILDVKPDRATRHESGRPFGLRGGRRKPRKK